jgi:WD40 repeat protein
MDALSLGINHLQNNQQINRQKSSKSNKIVHKNTISYNKFKTPCINGNLDKELLRTGDRFIPFKNDENFQNFLLNTPNLNISYEIEKTKIIESEKLSPLEEKPETNYASFIVDNMLRTNTDIYNFPQSKFEKLRKNSIYTFSKKISFNSSNIHNSSNSNTQQKDYNIFMENAKINKTSNKKSINSNNINTSNELLRTKNKNTKNILNIKNELFSSSLLYEPSHQNANQTFQINSLFNENNADISNNDLLFQLLDNSSNKRSVLPNSDYLLANYSHNCIFKRKINLTPERILDAPNLVDDYYLNLLEWGKSNILAVALGPEIYLWNGESSETSLLMSIVKDNNTIINNNNIITSLSWMNNGICLGVGLPNGHIELWDVIKGSKIREMEAHSARISCLSWNSYIISSGSKDKLIKSFDVRISDGEISNIHQHKQEVCSLKYSPEGDLLSSGGNDNVAYIWDVRKLNNKLINISNLIDTNNNDCYTNKPLLVNNYHSAAVKAMAWCPWQRHIIATGGGTKDKTIKVLNCDTNKIIKNVETGSQVCSLLWNKKERELISSHGFNKNQITIWNYKKMKKICELKGHMSRVLYLTMSPDENFICSGSGDETLRFWKINDGIKEVQNEEDPLLSNVLIR